MSDITVLYDNYDVSVAHTVLNATSRIISPALTVSNPGNNITVTPSLLNVSVSIGGSGGSSNSYFPSGF